MFQSCSEKYRLHYQLRLRSEKLYSALFFGKAIDEAFSTLLYPLLVDNTNYSHLANLDAEQVFRSHMLKTTHNEQLIDIPENELCEYFKSDCDVTLLTQEQKEDILAKSEEKINIVRFVDLYQKQIKDKQAVNLTDKKLYNFICWNSLISKGIMMIDAYKKQIIPKIAKVQSIQEIIKITNENGDCINGAIDFIASFSDAPDKFYICDNKTSSKPYDKDSVSVSDQLATYCEYKKNQNAAFVVVEKTVYKKNPRIHTQIIKDYISEEIMQKTFDNFEETIYKIEENKFSKNYEACFQFGRMCPYFAYCKSNGSNTKNLIQLGERNGTGSKK